MGITKGYKFSINSIILPAFQFFKKHPNIVNPITPSNIEMMANEILALMHLGKYLGLSCSSISFIFILYYTELLFLYITANEMIPGVLMIFIRCSARKKLF